MRPCLFGTASLLLGRSAVAFRDMDRVGHRILTDFGAQSHGPRARCLRFTADVAIVDARLASGWRHPLAGRLSLLLEAALGSYGKFPVIAFPFPQALLGAPMSPSSKTRNHRDRAPHPMHRKW